MGMKYRDPSTGQLKELSLKAADTLPIGTIVDYDGQKVPEGWEEYGTDDYSTEETFTGKHWIDGKPIYRKTIEISALANSASNTDYNHNISNVDSIWCDISHSFVKFSDNSIGNFQQVGALPNGGQINSMISIYSINTTKFTISTGTDRSNVSAYVTLEYTKTTD